VCQTHLYGFVRCIWSIYSIYLLEMFYHMCRRSLRWILVQTHRQKHPVIWGNGSRITSHQNWQQDIFTTSMKLPSTHISHNPIYYIQVLFYMCLLDMLGTAVAQWLRCCTTNWKVAGSIPAGVIGIFHWHKILPIVLWPWGQLSLWQK